MRLENAVGKSHSLAETIRNLGMRFSGGLHGHLSSKIRAWSIDTSHFSRNGCNRGKTPINKRHWTEILVHKPLKTKVDSKTLRRSLIESGREYKCAECDLPPVWRGKPLCIQVDHIDGDWENNLPINLRFICPNCHTQTDTFGIKNATVE